LFQGRVGNNAADKFRVCKSNLLPHPLDRGEGLSSPRPDNDRALGRGAATGVPGASATRAFVLMVFIAIYAPENINPAYAGKGLTKILKIPGTVFF
jgi:hypothetical protein